MKDASLTEMQANVVQVAKDYRRTGTIEWNYDIATKDLSYQVGMLAKRIMQYRNERFSEGLKQNEIKDLIANELADILAGVLFVSHDLEIDLHRAWAQMIESDKIKISSREKCTKSSRE